MIRLNRVVFSEAARRVAAMDKRQWPGAQSAEEQAFHLLGIEGLRSHRKTISRSRAIVSGMEIAERKNPKQGEGILRSGQRLRPTLCSRRNHRPDEIKAIDRSRYAVERRNFAG